MVSSIFTVVCRTGEGGGMFFHQKWDASLHISYFEIMIEVFVLSK